MQIQNTDWGVHLLGHLFTGMYGEQTGTSDPNCIRTLEGAVKDIRKTLTLQPGKVLNKTVFYPTKHSGGSHRNLLQG